MKYRVRSLEPLWQLSLALILAIALTITPDIALAQAGGGNGGNPGSGSPTGSPIADVFCILASWMTGDIAKAVAMLAIQISGIGALLGKISWGVALLVGTNIAVIFGALDIVALLSDGVTTNGCQYSATGGRGNGWSNGSSPPIPGR